ncbi:hypothetical protein [Ornithinibacillus californiensis]|uniref:hypothetical protein n=1 Tax=Ornithinibacillus californiensis TaxID=161536 RepID=UPI00064DCAE1|nr:hypothetical protein [Ornithinibacillus californiensis]
MIRKISMICLILLLVFPVIANASNNNNGYKNENNRGLEIQNKNSKAQEMQNKNEQERIEKINKLIAMLTEHRANKELEKVKSSSELSVFSKNSGDDFEEEIEVELSKLGVSKLNDTELNALKQNTQPSGEEAIAPMAYIPPDTSTVDWRSYRTTYNYNGTSYEIQQVIATGKNGNSNLADGRNGAVLYTNKQIAINGLKYIGSLVAQRAIGAVPVVSWLPYEFLFTENQNVTNNSHLVTYRSMNTVAFSYVKKSGHSDSNQELSLVSNYVTVASSHTLAGYRSGTPYSKTTDRSNTTYGPNYASTYTAVKSFIDPYGGAVTSFVNGYKFYNHNNTASISESVLNPEFPIQVY